jgi:hypothetical protein
LTVNLLDLQMPLSAQEAELLMLFRTCGPVQSNALLTLAHTLADRTKLGPVRQRCAVVPLFGFPNK